MSITPEQFRQMEARLNKNVKRHIQTGIASPIAKLESNLGDAPLATQEIQRPTSERLLVRVTSIRQRFLDEDNLCEKYHVDLCRYAGIIPDDSPDKIKIEVCQRKAKKGEQEMTVIEVLTINL
jgi:hypothetical protein